MKKRYLVVALLLMFIGLSFPKALTIGDCKVLASFKLSSSLDEEKYICKGIDYGTNNDAIYYSATEDIIHLNNLNAYYFTNWDKYDVTLDIKGQNNISLLHLSNSKFKVTGSGSLKFKQNSFVKKVINGEQVFEYVYNGKTLLTEDKKIYEGTTLEFEENYELLQKINNLPLEYNLEDYQKVSAVDYVKMTPVIVTENWLSTKIDTTLNKSVKDGYGIIEYIEIPKEEPKEEPKVENKEVTKLETDNVILISEKKLQKKYTLKETNLKDKEVADKVANEIEKDLISLYDVSIYNGQKEVSMKNGKYIIKIKIDSNIEEYENYQIIYVNDNDEIAEYIDGHIEDGYIVFETTHLSQYGVIATPKTDYIDIDINGANPVAKRKVNIGNILKISILVFLIIIAITLITVILIKSNLLKTKHKKRKRA